MTKSTVVRLSPSPSKIKRRMLCIQLARYFQNGFLPLNQQYSDVNGHTICLDWVINVCENDDGELKPYILTHTRVRARHNERIVCENHQVCHTTFTLSLSFINTAKNVPTD